MSIRYIGEIIKKTRIQAGQTQEQYSEGICDVTTLARIESGKLGTSPALFQAFMTKAGRTSEIFPCFVNREDFECFFLMREIDYAIQSLQISEAYNSMNKVKKIHWCRNKFYYQEWLYQYVRILKYSGNKDKEYMLMTLKKAMQLTRPDIDFSFLNSEVAYTKNEIGILLEIAELLCKMNCMEESSNIIQYTKDYLENNYIAYDEKEWYFIMIKRIEIIKNQVAGNHQYALELISKSIEESIYSANDLALIEFHTMMAVSCFRLKRTEEYQNEMKKVLFSLLAQKSDFVHGIVSELVSIGIKIPSCLERTLLEPNPLDEIVTDYDFVNDDSGMQFSDEEKFFDVGMIIGSLRREQNKSLQALSEGLCSKSTLSKIENGSMNPDIMLAEALLQRLGLCTEGLIFYGNKHESELYELRRNITIANRNDRELETKLVNELGTKIRDKEITVKQYYRYKQALRLPVGEGKIEALQNALKMTIPDFEFSQIEKKNMSWTELTIINNICQAYGEMCEKEEAVFRQKAFVKYLDGVNNISKMLKATIYPIALSRYSYLCFRERLYEELTEYDKQISIKSFGTKTILLVYYYANVCQAYCEIKEKERAKEIANFSYYLFLLWGEKQAADILRNVLQDEYEIMVD